MPRIGELRHRVTIEQPVEAAGTFGAADSVTWTTFLTTWASIEPLRGREWFQAQQVTAEVTHKVFMRYQAGVTAKMRVVFGSRVFNIEAVRNLRERGEWLELLCTEKT